MRASNRPTVLETEPFGSPRSAAAQPNEPASTTVAKTAQASKSGHLADSILETMSFHCFYFLLRKQASHCRHPEGAAPTPARSSSKSPADRTQSGQAGVSLAKARIDGRPSPVCA
jgi:hypothetical protein